MTGSPIDREMFRQLIVESFAADVRLRMLEMEMDRDRKNIAAQERRMRRQRMTAKEMVDSAGLSNSSKIAFLK